MEAPETRYARSGDYSIAYQVVGQGDLDLVYVPGQASHIEVFWEERRTHVSCTDSPRCAPPEPDRVLATVMFTDIVGSTKRAAEVGDSRWRELLEGHEAIVRRELARHRGREVNTTGDGFLATFDGPGRAIGFEDRGTHELKGVPGEWRLYAVTA
jgi:Adenylate and Guanylate cyclase catalytic domain